MREYWFSVTCILPYKDRILDSLYTGEYGSVKTRILIYFMQCNDNTECVCLSFVLTGFVFPIGKNCYPEVFLEEYKHAVKIKLNLC